MLKSLCLAMALIACAVSFGQTNQTKQDDKSVHHAAMHAEHTVHHSTVHAGKWIDRHVSAPHSMKGKKERKKKVASVHHAAMHAEHWLDHHVSAPHKTGGN